MSSRGQEFDEKDVPTPQSGLWQEHRSHNSFPSVRHVKALIHGQVEATATTTVVIVLIWFLQLNFILHFLAFFASINFYFVPD